MVWGCALKPLMWHRKTRISGAGATIRNFLVSHERNRATVCLRTRCVVAVANHEEGSMAAKLGMSTMTSAIESAMVGNHVSRLFD
jgi:hypothetical protein